MTQTGDVAYGPHLISYSKQNLYHDFSGFCFFTNYTFMVLIFYQSQVQIWTEEEKHVAMREEIDDKLDKLKNYSVIGTDYHRHVSTRRPCEKIASHE
jgi:hypothetical protein